MVTRECIEKVNKNFSSFQCTHRITAVTVLFWPFSKLYQPIRSLYFVENIANWGSWLVKIILKIGKKCIIYKGTLETKLPAVFPTHDSTTTRQNSSNFRGSSKINYYKNWSRIWEISLDTSLHGMATCVVVYIFMFGYFADNYASCINFMFACFLKYLFHWKVIQFFLFFFSVARGNNYLL